MSDAALCVFWADSALFSRSVILVSLSAAGPALLQEGNVKTYVALSLSAAWVHKKSFNHAVNSLFEKFIVPELPGQGSFGVPNMGFRSNMFDRISH